MALLAPPQAQGRSQAWAWGGSSSPKWEISRPKQSSARVILWANVTAHEYVNGLQPPPQSQIPGYVPAQAEI